MSDANLIAGLLASERRSAWGRPGHAPALAAWIAQARSLQGRLSQHRRSLAALRNLGQREGGRWVFAEQTQDWRHHVLQKLLAREAELATAIEREERRLRYSQEVERRTVGERRATWDTAARAVAADRRFAGLVLVPQVGLVPLGADPRSRLQEFAFLASGETPRRDARGRLLLDEKIAMVLVLVPGGMARIGARAGSHDALAEANEAPEHTVRLQPFLLAKHELTQGQWAAMCGTHPAHYGPARGLSLRHPVENVSWNDCRRALQRVGLRLPSEAQWEHAARGGTRTAWWTGASLASLAGAANVADRSFQRAGGRVAPAPWDDGHAVHAPAGSFRANPFGLHDTAGNVWEWCSDRMVARAYDHPAGPDGSRHLPPAVRRAARARVNRGGSWATPAGAARSAFRGSNSPDSRDTGIGVRPLRDVDR